MLRYLRTARIWLLKRRAKSVARNINALYDNFDCGSDLIDLVTGGRLTRYKRELKTLKDKLKELDPKMAQKNTDPIRRA